MVNLLNKITKAIFEMDAMSSAEILQKYHDIEVVKATKAEEKIIEEASKDSDEQKIIGSSDMQEDAQLTEATEEKNENLF